MLILSLAHNASVLAQEPAAPVVRVGFLADEPSPRADRIRALIQEELLGLAGDDFEVGFPEEYNVTGDGTVESIVAAVTRLANDDALDVLITLDFVGSHVAGTGAPWARPVVAAFVLDARLQGLPAREGTSGTPNLAYVTVPAPIARDLGTFQKIVPATTVHMLIDQEAGLVLGDFVDRVVQEAEGVGVDLRVVGVTTAEETLASIPADAEAIYVAPLTRMPRDEFQRLVDGINARGLASFAFNASDVEAGLMASLNPGDEPRLARRIAINAHRILLGDDPAGFSVNFAPGEELVINMRTVRRTGIIPPLGMILEARRLFEELEGIGREVTLRSAMEEASRANLTLAIQAEIVAAGRHDVRLATSELLPSVGADMTGRTISGRLAAAAGGTNPQNSVDATLNARQLLFSEPAWAN